MEIDVNNEKQALPMQPLGRMVRLAADALLDLVLPPVCRFCDSPIPHDRDFCRQCDRQLSLSQTRMKSSCFRCGRPQPAISETTSIPANPAPTCVHCQGEKYVFGHAIGLWVYQDRVQDAVVTAKFGHQAPLGAALGRRLGHRIIECLETKESPFPVPDIVTFVPSHWRRSSQRGGNGNSAISRAAFQTMKNSLRKIRYAELLKMTRATAKQAWLDVSQRRENVRGAFAIKNRYPFVGTGKRQLVGQNILVIDDVLTTGATGNEVSRVLLDAGAKSVTLAIVARAIQT